MRYCIDLDFYVVLPYSKFKTLARNYFKDFEGTKNFVEIIAALFVVAGPITQSNILYEVTYVK